MIFRLIHKVVHCNLFSISKIGTGVLLAIGFFSSSGLIAAEKLNNPPPFPISFLVSDYNGFGVTCNGSTDGSIDLTINGGIAPYDISWSNGSVTEDISGLGAGNYIVTIIDDVQDTTIDSVLITEPAIIDVAFAAVTSVTCNGFSDGAIDMTSSGGTGVFSFAWNGGSITEDLSGLIAGNYSVTVTDNNSCSATSDTIITEPAVIVVNVVTQDANAAPDGQASTTPTGGTGSFSYLWSTGATISSISGLLPGSYTVTVTDANLCSVTEVATINNALGVCAIVTDSVFNVTCNGLDNGSIYISTFAAIAPISYQWSNGAVTEDVTGLAPGTYTVTITDVILCTATQSFVITEPATLDITATPVAETCNANNGSVSTSVSGGTGTYSYLWSNSAVTATITGLNFGTYTVTVTDQNGCTDVTSAIVIAVTPPQVVVDSILNVRCFGGATGAVYTTTTNGTLPYSVIWSNSSTTQDITGLVAGTYTITVTDADLCTSTTSGIVTQPLAALNDSVQTTRPTCGNSNGSITVYPYAGTSPYTYLWSNLQTTQTISGLAAGTYTVTVTDANLCTRQRIATITNLAGPVASLDSIRTVKCFGGLTGGVFISVTGGTAPLIYLWSNSAITQDIQNVAAGTYTVTVTDGNSCTSTTSGIVTQPLAALNDSVQTTRPTCGNSNGSITVYPYAGTSPYTYLWSNLQTTQTISGLAAGTYTVTVTDANLCTRQRVATITNLAGPVASLDSIRTVKCFGGLTGGVFISVSGGTTPLTYLWSNSAITQDIQNVAAGTYTVTVTDANSCTSTTSGIVTQPLAALNDSVQTINPTCGNSNGSITVYPYAGTSPYTYLWSNLQTSQTISGLTTGTYTVTISDANLCTRQRVSTLVNVGGPVAVIDSVRNVRCFGGATGGVFISVSGGTTPYTYLWSNGAVTQDIQNVVAGVKTVTVTDANSCTSTLNATITQPLAALADSVRSTRPTCGLNNGSITIYPYNGTSPYTFIWSNLQTTQTISGLAAGTYTVTVTDANLCTRARSVLINNFAPPVAVLDSVRNVRCFGTLTGGVFVSFTGGSSPFVYQWSNGATTQDIQNVAAGTYTFTVTDANSCTSTVSATVTQPAAISDSVQVTNSTCAVANGIITIFPFGGTPGYTYLWNNSQTTQSISGLTAGSYTVTITDANLCTRLRVVSVSNLSGPVAVIDSVRKVRCFGGLTGGVFISASGGTAPLTYLWSNSAVTQDIQNVAFGNYTVTVTDANNCTVTLDTIVTQPAALVVNTSITNAPCGQAAGVVAATPTGGTSPYGYLWNTGLTTSSISGLLAGTYTVTVTDANNCTSVKSSVVGASSGPSLVLDSIRNVRCNGAATGAVYISVTGGLSPFTYLWTGGSTGQDLINVIAGTYTVVITDTNNCTDTLSATITQSPALNDSIQINNAQCGAPTGSATVFAYGGTSPFTYLWNTGSVSSTIFNLNSGSYTVTITDAFGCTLQDVANVSSTGGPVVTIDSIRNVKCNGAFTGGVFISVSGGTFPYDYLWSNFAITQDISAVGAGTYTVTVTDDNSCSVIVSGTITQPSLLNDSTVSVNSTCGLPNGSVTTYPYGGVAPYSFFWNGGQTSQTISGLTAGIYTVTVTDFNGCTVIRQDTVFSTGGPLAVVDSVKNVNCFGGTTGAIFITATGGTGLLTYLWSNSATTSDLIGVGAGTYTVTVTDQNSCTVTLTATILQSSAVQDSVQVTPEACDLSNGAINLYPFGGTPPYTFLWNNGSVTQNLTGLVAGTYTVTVTDSLGCQKTTVVVVPQVGGPQIGVDSVVQVSCFGLSDGGIFISVSGGTVPFSYSWSNSAVVQDITNLQAGNYSVIVVDSFLCRDTAFFSITEPDALQDSVIVESSTCGLSNGSVTVYPYGGTPLYSYLWSDGQTTQTALNLLAGTITVTVTDDNGCTLIDTVTVNDISGQVIGTDSVIDVSCFGLSDGAVYLTVTGGTLPYDFEWSNAATTEDILGLVAGTYTVTVTDSNSCSTVQTFNISEPDLLTDSTEVNNSTCGLANGAAAVFPAGGTLPYTYLWNTNATSASISNVVSGIYTVTVTDFNGCSLIDTLVINDVGGPVVTLDSIIDVSCNGFNDGAIYISISSGLPSFNYLWSNLANTQDISGLIAGVYSLTVTDQSNCQQFISFTVNEPDILQDTAVITPSTCGSFNGAITVYPYGGTSPYTYLWSTGSVNQSISGLDAGNYTVTITDTNSCSVTTQYILNNLSGPVLSLDTIIQVSCAGDSTGAVNLTVNGGAEPYNYLWSNLETTEDLVNIPSGTYTVTVTDQNSCSVTITNIINEPPPVTVVFTISPASCNVANGAVSAAVSGGVPGYDLLWNINVTTPAITGLVAGVYTLTVTDDNNCINIFNAAVSNLAAPEITVVDSGNVSCPGLNDGFITVSVTGGATPYIYSWTNTSQTGNQLTGLTGNITYTLTITDSLGCIAILPVLISAPAQFSINGLVPQLNDTFNLSCFGSNDGSITLNVTGGSEPYQYLWSNFETTSTIDGLSAGNYTVTITDDNGCSVSESYTLTQPALLVSNAGPNKVICGFNSDTLAADVPLFGSGYWLVVSGTGTFADSTLPNSVVTNLTNGVNVYQWVVTDGICSAFSQVVITFNTQISAIAGVNQDVCDNFALLAATAPQFGFGYWQVIESDATIADTSIAVTAVTGLNPGPNVFRWFVLNGTCIDSADVTIYLNDPSECFEELEMPTGFTPNGDGKNDFFVVHGIDDYPDNIITVYNRWGNLVFEKSGYLNDWDGTNNSGDPLAAGTYFVIFKVRSIDKIIKTYVDIRR